MTVTIEPRMQVVHRVNWVDHQGRRRFKTYLQRHHADAFAKHVAELMQREVDKASHAAIVGAKPLELVTGVDLTDAKDFTPAPVTDRDQKEGDNDEDQV